MLNPNKQRALEALEKYKPMFHPDFYFSVGESCVIYRNGRGYAPIAYLDGNFSAYFREYLRQKGETT